MGRGRGAVWRRIVGAVTDRFAGAERGAQDPRDQVGFLASPISGQDWPRRLK
jgi:hypothetical protein